MYGRRESTVVKGLAVLIGLWAFLLLYFNEDAKGAGRVGSNELDVKIMSFNIRYGTANDGENRWLNRREMVFDVMRNHKSDVVGLQEALKFQIDEILDAVPGFAMVGVGREDGKTKGEYSAILYNRNRFKVDESGTFWLSDTPDVPGSITWGNACTRICTWARLIEKTSGKAFYAFNVHLDHVSQPSRERAAVLLAQRIRSREHSDPFVLTGDFNVGENNSVVTYLKGTSRLGGGAHWEHANPVPMVDTFRVLHPDMGDVGTFNGFKGRRTGEKIDYVFAPAEVKVDEAQILHNTVDGRTPSDHFPVIAHLRLSLSPSP
ncbi:MAG: endonuclease/exonuclease/phosphatase family protein [Sedimentisphaerales bacterium]|nr:endonuclease/exonuclease/phosphatase family protein [Sedimentisphaerales bacterium]